jgi:cation:H+ antiporter
LLPRFAFSFVTLLLVAAPGIPETGPWTILWAAPSILLAAVLIAWAAESAQYFVAQGFALAILAWLQTLPEFAVEAVIAWHRDVPLLMANLTGALRLLTGFGWPVIYLTAAFFNRRNGKGPLRSIRLHGHHAVEVVGLAVPLLYMVFVAWKNSLTNLDAVVLIAIYAAYLWILSKLPPEDVETLEDLESVPRRIVTAPRIPRILAIAALFAFGGILIYLGAEPFLGSLLALSAVLGIPTFVFVQWMAPLVSEFPEMASTFYWARTVDRAPIALMNMVSSNINQWTLLAAMLPVILSVSAGQNSAIVFDAQQHTELTLTIAQAAVGLIFLINMELVWWEAAVLLALFLLPFASPSLAGPVTWMYVAWIGLELIRMLAGQRRPLAMVEFARVWRKYVQRPAAASGTSLRY